MYACASARGETALAIRPDSCHVAKETVRPIKPAASDEQPKSIYFVVQVQSYSPASRVSKTQELLNDTLEFICANILQPAFTGLHTEDGDQDDRQRHRNCPNQRDRRHGRRGDTE